MSDFCNDEEWLAAYLDKRLTEEERLLYEIHVSKCSYCLAELISAKKDLDEMAETPAMSSEKASSLSPESRPAAAGHSWLGSLLLPAGPARFRGLSAQAVTISVAFIAAMVLGLGFFRFLVSPGWDPDFKSGRSGIRRILSTSKIGELRISGGQTIPVTKTTTVRGTGMPERKIFENTLRSLNNIKSKYPQDPEIYTLLGHLYLARNLPARAEVSYNMARLLNPEDAKTFNNLAVTAYRRGDIESSLDYLMEAIRRDNIPPEAYYNLGILYHETGNISEMTHFLNIYLEKDSNSHWAERARSLLEE